MKKHAKKLTLHRETLLNLEGSEMRRIVGGEVRTSMECLLPTGCECQTADGCAPHTGVYGTCSMGGTSYHTCTNTYEYC